jgi:ubiquitin carboxyl-terminal hydrolase 8
VESLIRSSSTSRHTSTAEMAAANPRAGGYPNGNHGALSGGNTPSQQPWPHISDVTSVTPDVDSNWPIQKLLTTGEEYLWKAESLQSFGRKPQAMKEYLRGSIIAIQLIPHHRDYLRLCTDTASRRYDALKAKVALQHSTYESIKKEIMLDNQRTRVQPQSRSENRPNGQPPPPTTSAPTSAPTSAHAASPHHIKAKPAVHPKPASLHGNQIKRGASRGSDGQSDLSSRFANLGGPVSMPQQDPRIKTQQITLPPESPAPISDGLPKLGLVSDLPGLPKVPDAIYSPARGTVSTEAGQLPSSTTRGLFSRTPSSASLSFPNIAPSPHPLPSHPPPPPPLTTPLQTNGLSQPAGPPAATKKSTLSLPGDTIGARELLELMKDKSPGWQILMIDVRPRDQFDEGHIMWQSIICIEPSVLMRENISAEQISESNVLAPQEEMALFEKRDSFDLVVFYDQNSERVAPKTSSDHALIGLQRSLVYFNYKKDLRNPPKLLRGGIEAWTDLLGAHSLSAYSASSASTAPKATHKKPSLSLAPARGPTSRAERRQGFVIRSLPPDEIRQWQETLKQDEMDTAQSPNFVRSTEDFLRRFPPVGPEQESMTSPVNGAATMAAMAKKYSDLPSPPTRPAPALPRPSYSGLGDNFAAQQPQYIDARAAAAQVSAKPSRAPFRHTGLHNPHNWCYANSVVQAFLASRGFSAELAKVKNENMWLPAPKDYNAQLMLKILGNLLMWMSTGSIDTLRPQTLMDYSKSIHDEPDLDDRFGGSKQQDAREYLSFLLGELDKETNKRSGREKGQADLPDATGENSTSFDAAFDFWQHHTEAHESIVDKYFTGVYVDEFTCTRSGCGRTAYKAQHFTIFVLHVSDRSSSLDQALHSFFDVPEDIERKCVCKHEHAKRITHLARLPELFIIALPRFKATSRQNYAKDMTVFQFDPDNLDFERYFPPVPDGRADDCKKLAPTFEYECYAIIVHKGDDLRSGHYMSYVRNDKIRERGRWLKISDKVVEETELGTNTALDQLGQLEKCAKDTMPYLLFYRRKRRRDEIP